MNLKHFFGVIAVASSMAIAASSPALAGAGGNGHHSSSHGGTVMTVSGLSNTMASGGSTERDVRGASVDPSAKVGHDRDNGLGNSCDPGLGGELTGTGNFARFGAKQAADTTCHRTHGGVSGVTTKTHGEPSEVAAPNAGVSGATASIAVNGRVITLTAPQGAVSAAQAGIGLAKTGGPLVPLAAATAFLLAAGLIVRKLRPIG